MDATTTGSDNASFGYKSGINNITGSQNTFIGCDANSITDSSALQGSTALGYNTTVSSSHSVYVGYNTTSIGGPVGWTNLSDGRFKENVQENVPGINFIMKLRPVTYNLNYRKCDLFVRGTDTMLESNRYEELYNIKQTGFIAQEVEKAASDLNYDFHGVDKPQNKKTPYGLRYSEFVVPLVKAVQEQQNMLQTQASTIDSLQQTLAQQQEVLSSVLSQLQEIKECCSRESGGNTIAPQSNPAQLFKAVPNPTSGAAAIYYYVPQTSKVAKIQLTSTSGQILQTIAIGNFGYDSAPVQVGNLAGGTYLYSLIVDDQLIDTKKLDVVLK